MTSDEDVRSSKRAKTTHKTVVRHKASQAIDHFDANHKNISDKSVTTVTTERSGSNANILSVQTYKTSTIISTRESDLPAKQRSSPRSEQVHQIHKQQTHKNSGTPESVFNSTQLQTFTRRDQGTNGKLQNYAYLTGQTKPLPSTELPTNVITTSATQVSNRKYMLHQSVNGSSNLPLTKVECEVRQLKDRMLAQHAEMTKWLLYDARRPLMRFTTHMESISPFATLKPVPAAAEKEDCIQSEVIGHGKKSRGKSDKRRRYQRYSQTSIHGTASALPKYSIDIGIKQNILSHPMDSIKYIPCLGGDTGTGIRELQESLLCIFTESADGCLTPWKSQMACIAVEKAFWLQNWLIEWCDQVRPFGLTSEHLTYFTLRSIVGRRTLREECLLQHYETQFKNRETDSVTDDRFQLLVGILDNMFHFEDPQDRILIDQTNALSIGEDNSPPSIVPSKQTFDLQAVLLSNARIDSILDDIPQSTSDSSAHGVAPSTYESMTCLICSMVSCPTHGEISKDVICSDLPYGNNVDRDKIFKEEQWLRVHVNHVVTPEEDTEENYPPAPKLKFIHPKTKKLSKNWQSLTTTHLAHNRDNYYPCFHTGPCSSGHCYCFKEKGFCEESCGCSKDCPRRFPGCACGSKGRSCIDRTSGMVCICVTLNRECGPQCHSCGAAAQLNPKNKYNDEVFRTGCQNTPMQRGIEIKTVVGVSKLLARIGVRHYGLYNAETVRKGQYIGEYTGEASST